ncbi:MAG: hypothetical protein AB8B50_08390 [Pirellulaceae bacterium]
MPDQRSQDDSPELQPNPFEPAALEWVEDGANFATRESQQERRRFWGLSVACLGAAIGLSVVAPQFGLPCVAITTAAPIRVIAFRRVRRRELGDDELPSSLQLLGSSLLLVFAMGFATCIAFVMVCLPTGFVTFSLLGQSVYEDWLVVMVFGVSALLAFVVFLWLFRLSLRLRR